MGQTTAIIARCSKVERACTVDAMASQRTAGDDIADRLQAVENELARQRRALAVLADRLESTDLDRLIDEFADRPMSEEEMETVFARLDATLDVAR